MRIQTLYLKEDIVSYQRLNELDVMLTELIIFTNINPDSVASCNRAAESLELDSTEEHYVYFSLRSRSSFLNFDYHLSNIKNVIIKGD